MAQSYLDVLLRKRQTAPALPQAGALPDQELLELFVQHRDEAAFTALVRRHGPMVFQVCRRVLRHTQDAEDAFQATFLVLARKANAIHRRTSAGSWLHGVAHRISLKARSQSLRRAEAESQAPVPANHGDDVTSHKLRNLLDAELERLPASYRSPLVLCFLEGQTQDEATLLLGWSKSTFRRRLDKAREKLRVRLERRGLTLSAGLFATLLSNQAASAALPAVLESSTVQAGLSFAAGKTTAECAVSSSVAALVHKMLASLYLTEAIVVGGVLVVVGAIFTGAGFVARDALAKLDFRLAPRVAPVAVPAAFPGVALPQRPFPKSDRRDHYGDPLPKGALARLGTERFRHTDSIASISFSPDGKTLATAGATHVLRNMWSGIVLPATAPCVKLWDAATGSEKVTISCEQYPTITTLAFSPDGKTLAVGASGHAVLNRAAPQGEFALWDLPSGRWRSLIGCGNTYPVFVAFAPDGKTLAAASDEINITLWSDAGKRLASMTGHTKKVLAAAFSPDGQTLASAGADNTVRLWDATTGRKVRQFDGHGGPVNSVAFTGDGSMLVSGSDDGTIRLWDVSTGAEANQLGEHRGRIAVSPDGNYAVAGSPGNALHLWDLRTGQSVRTFEPGSRSVGSLAFSPDGQRLAAVELGSNAVQIWDVASGKEIGSAGGHFRGVTGLAYSADGKALFSSAMDGSLRRWEVASGKETLRLGGQGPIHALARSPDGSMLAWSSLRAGKHFIQLWDAATGKELRRLEGHEEGLNGLAFSPDSKSLASASDDSIVRLWDVASGPTLKAFAQFGATLSSAFSLDGAFLASAAKDGVIRIWSVPKGQLVLQLAGPRQGCRSLAFSADGKILAAGSDTDNVTPIALWEMPAGKPLQGLNFQPPVSGVLALAFSPDGKTLAAGGHDQSISLWELATGTLRHRFERHEGIVGKLAFSPDGRTLASGSDDTTIIIWDVLSDQKPNTVALSPSSLQTLWDELSRPDAAKAYAALLQLAAGKETISFLKDRLRPVPVADPSRGGRLAKELASTDADVREKAIRELESLDELAAPVLLQILDTDPGPDVGKEIARLQNSLPTPNTPAPLRMLRAVELLERLATRETRGLLKTLSQGSPEARLTQEAKAALNRLDRNK